MQCGLPKSRVWTWLYSPAFFHPFPPPLPPPSFFTLVLSPPHLFPLLFPPLCSSSLLQFPPFLFLSPYLLFYSQNVSVTFDSNTAGYAGAAIYAADIRVCTFNCVECEPRNNITQYQQSIFLEKPPFYFRLGQNKKTVNFVFHFHLTLSAAPRPKITVLYSLIYLVKLWWIMQQSSCMLQKCYNIPFWLACRRATANKVWCQNKPMHRDVVIC